MSRRLPIQPGENPRYSDAGALPVVVEQTYWERMRKHGRTGYKHTSPAATSTSLNYTTNINAATVGQVFIPHTVSIGVTTDSLVFLAFRPDAQYDPFSSFNSGYEYLWAGYIKAGESFTYYLNGLVELRPSGELRWQVQALSTAGSYTSNATGVVVAVDD